MRRLMTPLFAAALLLMTGAAIAQRGAAAPPLVRDGATEKISDHVYVIPDNNVGMVPNVGIIVGTRGTLVIDTGLGARNGQTIVARCRRSARHRTCTWRRRTSIPSTTSAPAASPPTTKMIRSQAQVAEIAADKTADRAAVRRLLAAQRRAARRRGVQAGRHHLRPGARAGPRRRARAHHRPGLQPHRGRHRRSSSSPTPSCSRATW